MLVYNTSLEDHIQHLHSVLTLPQDNQLFANTKKCQFGQPKLEYLGHIISAQGVEADANKVAAMLSWPLPKSLKELRGFLGLTGYYRRFIIGYGEIARPLTDQLKKDGFHWSGQAEKTFVTLKQVMSSVPVLALPDLTQPFILETDASGQGLGVVLTQNSRPIAFFSQALSPRARQKSVYERELMAIVFGI